MRTITTVAFIGLGVMGYPMAGHLAKQGLTTRVYNRTSSKADAWANEFGGTAHATPKEAADGADLVLICVGNDDDVRQVTTGTDGVLSSMATGTYLIDHTTASADLALELDITCRNQGVAFLDAPVSGGQQGAENGALTIMCGGEQAHFDAVHPILNHYARAVTLMGGASSGQLTKMVNQICIAGLVQGLAEGLHFAEQAGLDQQQVIDVVSKGAAGSWQMENRHKTMIADEYNHGFAVDWMRKDLGICLEQARRLSATLPVTALVDQFYADVQRMDGGRWDTSSLLKRLQKPE
ncbi:NAD(P)-dependent oxidoreductase [Vreelandella venusta]|uniref:Oxidoreductase n=1 Tax=Vreelandella venusta TaxID=44935 RepID=A0AAP9ZFC9_9GAMM|nr:NAD(P)-dependent oxidoreductase [Halomonas venusta]MBR9925243.1 NAD(P)-dependent oxidoreductase [Gammaproteobacteria bacterium]AZM95175.1 NAD(P)-dependent oxidoreductase [Halomonas venusta]MDW0361249.1 NAD(P)-dependent oxidoreductase [Halomonas venusta]NPT29686.1 oxidoreductase [Halomonas venusta]QRL04340.1 NAD(P)-dependent oxidoreductase [Halomonas venusta]